MSEQKATPAITGKDGRVQIDLPNDMYMQMNPETARTFAAELIKAAMRAEGQKVGYYLGIEVPED